METEVHNIYLLYNMKIILQTLARNFDLDTCNKAMTLHQLQPSHINNGINDNNMYNQHTTNLSAANSNKLVTH